MADLLREDGSRLLQEAASALLLESALYAPPGGLVWLAELTAYDPGSSSVITHRFASGPGYDNAGTWYAPRILNPATLSRSMGGDAAGGRATTQYGELTLSNPDGALSALADDYFDGRAFTLKVGSSGAAYSTFRTVLTATIESVACETDTVSVRLRDRVAVLDTPHSTLKYTGGNALPAGIEGNDDLKDKPKPLLLGRVALMQPVLVNTSKLIYQVHAGSIESLVNVFDGGAYLSRSDDYVSQASMEANAPANGSFRCWPGGGCFRLGSSPFGTVSCSVVELWDYAPISAAGIMQRLLTARGFTAADWVAADFAALNQKNAGSLGLLVGDHETTASLLDRVAQSVGAWWGFDALNRFRVARLDAPSGAVAAAFDDSNILTLERQPDAHPPRWSVTLQADQNHAVQDAKGLAGIVPPARANWFAAATRDQKSELPTVKTTRLLADVTVAESLLNGVSVAKAEAARRVALFSVRRDTVTLTAADSALSLFATLDLGAVVSVTTNRLGYGAGKLFTVVGLAADLQRNTLDLTLWG